MKSMKILPLHYMATCVCMWYVPARYCVNLWVILINIHEVDHVWDTIICGESLGYIPPRHV